MKNESKINYTLTEEIKDMVGDNKFAIIYRRTWATDPNPARDSICYGDEVALMDFEPYQNDEGELKDCYYIQPIATEEEFDEIYF